MRRLIEEFHTSERRVCGLMEIPRMSYRYRSCRDDSALRERLLELAREKPRFGYRRLWVLLVGIAVATVSASITSEFGGFTAI